MNILLYGQDHFRSQERLTGLAAEFRLSYGETDLIKIDGAEVDLDRFLSLVQTLPFLSSQRMVVIRQLFGSGNPAASQILEQLSLVPQTTTLIFYEGKIAPKVIETFRKESKIEKYDLLRADELKHWALAQLGKEDFQIEPAALEKLIISCGPDLYLLNNELHKLTAFKTKEKKITLKDVLLLVRGSLDLRIFDLIDAISERKIARSAQLILKLLLKGEDSLAIFGMIVSHFRNLILVEDERRRTKGLNEIVRALNLHPFVVKKALAALANFSLEELREIYQELLSLDLAQKSGKIEGQEALQFLLLKVQP